MSPIVLTLPYPISANRYWSTRVIKPKTGGPAMAMTYVSAEAKAYKEQVAWIVRQAGIREPLLGRVAVDIQLYPQRPQDWARRFKANPLTWDDDVRCMDLDNARKVLYDALKGSAFTDDDRVFRDSGRRMEPDGAARVVVTITPLAKAVHPQAELLKVAA